MNKIFELFRKKTTWEQAYPYLLAVGAALGLYGAVILTIDKIQLLQEPTSKFICDLNPILSCGSVMGSPQAEAFGFANSIIGVFGFTIVLTIGMSVLAGAKFKQWFWLGLQAGTIFGIGFVHWLMFQSLYRIGALCLYCMLVWSVMIPIFLYTTMYNLKNKNIKLNKKYHDKIVKFFDKHHAKVLVLWYLAIITAILVQFWEFWSSLF